MGAIRTNFYVEAPLEQVWAFALDPERIPEWQPKIAAIKDVFPPGRAPARGTSYTLVYRFGIFRRRSPVEILHVEPLKMVETLGRIPLGGVSITRTQMWPDGPGTSVQYRLDYRLPGGFLGRWLDRLIFQPSFERDTRRANANYKRCAEAAAS